MTAGAKRLILVGYAILALAATGRSSYELFTKFDNAPFAYTFSAIAAAHYFFAFLALARSWRRFALIIIILELIGVVSVGLLTVVIPGLFAANTVWSYFGIGYGFLPVVLPSLGLWWLAKENR